MYTSKDLPSRTTEAWTGRGARLATGWASELGVPLADWMDGWTEEASIIFGCRCPEIMA